MSLPAILACDHLGYSTQGQALLTDVSLALRPGEKLGVVGPNGSGKSTLLRLLAGLSRPSTGAVQLAGRPLAGLRRRDVAQRLAVVQQQADTAERLRVREVVGLGRTPWLSALRPWGAADDLAVADALRAVGLEAFAERAWHSLSGGERQRAHIARALAQQPQVLLLDEPTNHLDIHQQLSLLRLVRELPVACVIALHDLNQALSCDRLAVLDHGRLVALGAPSDVLDPARLRQTFAVEGRWLLDPHDGGRVLVMRGL